MMMHINKAAEIPTAELLDSFYAELMDAYNTHSEAEYQYQSHKATLTLQMEEYREELEEDVKGRANDAKRELVARKHPELAHMWSTYDSLRLHRHFTESRYRNAQIKVEWLQARIRLEERNDSP